MNSIPLKRPLLRYLGGKYLLSNWIISNFPPHYLYCEPFGGGASVLCQKTPSLVEVYNDLDSRLVNFFRVLRKQSEELIRQIELTPYDEAIEVIQRYDSPETLFYLDPPYVTSTRSISHRQEYFCELTEEDHIELANTVRSAQGMCIISGYRSELYDSLYQGWQRIEKQVQTNGRTTVIECLWISPRCKSKQSQLSLFEGGGDAIS